MCQACSDGDAKIVWRYFYKVIFERKSLAGFCCMHLLTGAAMLMP
ncbi:hypothetical protein ALP12_102579 [Pseudomonas savastanoi pv. phaseolicola]|uniref:Uncharacterized protein n=1 Tax=Pseudomonas savastanoi pv. phaseolicola TaxID=319 RepID=A0A0P9WBC3_PSESH|nr:Unknown protein sequence [Pseudomonas savastanoi pv. phaseolicola]KPB66308.1 Unknown protein sequence [Pseudomonas amygdali pv. mellea]KPY12708.1 hypothetical protein ALO55_103142 [Pseudomonas savastanoi pv. phaseolicola]RMQ50347.1 hypothetical protein ALQ02_102696 [Pseudomonas savastanoi pv. phaseolicola]RMT08524.1 hypothetical protein ALP53_102818 [Pseudomonas savastanoi pv. phaseolicola]